jgi:hypothetical protein
VPSAFPDWRGVELLAAPGQGIYWFPGHATELIAEVVKRDLSRRDPLSNASRSTAWTASAAISG